MKPFAHHICGIAVLALLATSARGQEMTADRAGLSDLRSFAEHCLRAAPSFDSAARTIRVRNQPDSRLRAQLRVRAETKLELFERNDNCVCASSFFHWHTRLPQAVQNLHYVVKEEAGREWTAAKQDPTEIELNFEGTPAFVRIGYRETKTKGVLVVSAMIERQGSCPT